MTHAQSKEAREWILNNHSSAYQRCAGGGDQLKTRGHCEQTLNYGTRRIWPKGQLKEFKQPLRQGNEKTNINCGKRAIYSKINHTKFWACVPNNKVK